MFGFLSKDVKFILEKKDFEFKMYLENNYKGETAKAFYDYKETVEKLYQQKLIGEKRYKKYKDMFAYYIETMAELKNFQQIIKKQENN